MEVVSLILFPMHLQVVSMLQDILQKNEIKIRFQEYQEYFLQKQIDFLYGFFYRQMAEVETPPCLFLLSDLEYSALKVPSLYSLPGQVPHNCHREYSR